MDPYAEEDEPRAPAADAAALAAAQEPHAGDYVGNREPVTFTAWAGEVDCGEVYGIH